MIRTVLRKAFNVGVLLLAVWFLWGVVRDAGLRAVGERLLRADLLLVSVILLANVLRFLLLGLRWEILVRREAPMGFRPILSILMAGNFLNLIAPAVRVAGPVLRAYYLSRETGRPRARFYGTIVADQTANFSVFAAAMVVSGVMTAARGSPGMSFAAGAALMGALLGGLYVARRQLERFKSGEPSLLARLLRAILGGEGREGGLRARFIAWWEHMLEALCDAILGVGTWWPAIGVSAALFLVLSAAQALSCAAIGTPIGLTEAAFAVSAAAFVQVLAASPGGVGVTEASLVLMFLAIGLDTESAAAAAFLARLMNYLTLIPWGGWCFFRLQRRHGPAREEAAAEA